MKLWMSGEIQADVDSAYMKARNVIQPAVNRLLAAVSIPGKVDEWISLQSSEKKTALTSTRL